MSDQFKTLIASALFLALTLFSSQATAQDDVPSCTVDQNIQPLLKLNVDETAYAKAVLPSMRQILKAHLAALTTYQVPFKTLWEATGLSQLFPNGVPACCDACTINNCAGDFVFTKRVGGDKSFAKFEWRMNHPQPGGRRLSYTLGVVDAEFVLPTSLHGTAAIGPDYIILDFGDAGPTFKLTDKDYENQGKAVVTFDDRVRCTGTLAQWAVLKPLNSRPTIPHLNFFIEPK
jgi:hypothetical protein